MQRSLAFGDLVTQLTAHLSLRQVRRLTGISHTTINDWRNGMIPKNATLALFAERMGLNPEVRAQLFQAAGLVDPEKLEGQVVRVTGLRPIEDVDVSMFPNVTELEPEDMAVLRAMVKAFIRERRKQRGETENREGGAG